MKALFFSLFIYLGMQVHGQPREIKNLVFEGAGVRGIAYAGVITSLEEQGIAKKIERVGGTSAGAITALLFSLGYSGAQLDSVISNTKFQKFNDGRFIFFGGINRTKNNFGWYRGEEFKKWIGELIEDRTGSSETNFQELHELGFRDLYVTATCLNKQQLVVLSKENYPKMKVKDAVRISMSIPLYYEAVFVNQDGETFSKQNKEINLDVMVDGGIIGNYPLNIFDFESKDSLGNPVTKPNLETIGVRMDSEIQIEQDEQSKMLASVEIEDFADYISAFYVMVLENLNRKDLTDSDWERTISVSQVGISPKVKRLSQSQKERLIASGYESANRYFKSN